MRRCGAVLLAVCLLVGCAFALGGCGAEGIDLLGAVKDISAVTLSDGTRVWALCATEDGFSAQITSPPQAAGVQFRLSAGASYASVGAVTIPIDERVASAVRPLGAIFTLGVSQPTSVETDGKGALLAHYLTDVEEVSVYIDASGTLQFFSVAGVQWTVQNVTRTAG